MESLNEIVEALRSAKAALETISGKTHYPKLDYVEMVLEQAAEYLSKTHYVGSFVKTEHFREYDNWNKELGDWQTRVLEQDIWHRDTREKIMEVYAREAIRHHPWGDSRDGEYYCTVEFGPILEVMNKVEVTQEEITSHPLWLEHARKMRDKAERERVAKIAADEVTARAREKAEREELARLKSIYEPKEK